MIIACSCYKGRKLRRFALLGVDTRVNKKTGKQIVRQLVYLHCVLASLWRCGDIYFLLVCQCISHGQPRGTSRGQGAGDRGKDKGEAQPCNNAGRAIDSRHG